MRIFRGGVRSIDMRALTMIVYFVTSEYQRFIVLRPSSTLPPAAAHLYRQFCLIGCSINSNFILTSQKKTNKNVRHKSDGSRCARG